MKLPFGKRWRGAGSFVLAGWAAFSILVACGKEEGSAPILTASSGEITGVLEIEPFPPAVMSPARITLTLTDSEGHGLSGAAIRFDLTMPAMEMPENRAEAEEVAPGRYQAEVLFTMAGEWQIDADLALEGVQERLTFLLGTR